MFTKTKKNQEIHLDSDGTSDNIVRGDICDITAEEGIYRYTNLPEGFRTDYPKYGDVGTFQGKKYYHVGRDAWYPWVEIEEREHHI